MSARSQRKLDLDAVLLNRVIAPDAGTLSREAAQSILALGFNRRDVARMNRLAQRNQAGKLTAAEDEALESYLRVGRFLALLQAKARHSLQDHAKVGA